MKWLGIAVVLTVHPALATVYLTVPQALDIAFPKPIQAIKKREFLKEQDLKAINQDLASGEKLTSGLLTYYEGTKNKKLMGVAYLDTHMVRTLAETIMVVVNSEGKVQKIEILSFEEPPDYLVSKKWLEQFEGKKLSKALSLKAQIRGITGATLTAQAITHAVRRVLAIHRYLYPTSGGAS